MASSPAALAAAARWASSASSSRTKYGGAITATPRLPPRGVLGERDVSAVVCAPQWTITGSGPSRNSSARASRSAAESSIALPGRAEREHAVQPGRGQEVQVRPNASSSSAAPSSRRGVTAAASAPRSMPTTLRCAAMQALRVEAAATSSASRWRGRSGGTLSTQI
jgi:hypothetical protein